MNKLDWKTVSDLLVRFGLPVTIKIVEKWLSGGNPTMADLLELQDMSGRKAKDSMTATLQANNIDPASELGKALLAMAS